MTHGSKNWADIGTWDGKNKTFQTLEHYTHGSFLLHDQEPVDINYIHDLLEHVTDGVTMFESDKKNSDITTDYNVVTQICTELDYNVKPIEFMSLVIKTIKVPIICHSEKNSPDIKKLEEVNWIPCYYWWHGMVARDWFRHWERHNDLQIKNKANAKYRFLIYSREFTGTREYRTQVIDHLTKYQNQVNYNWNQDYRCPTMSATIDVVDANNSAIHLVAETLFDTEKIYLTEKIFKPMVMSQPFILFGPPGSLRYLRDYGFKTFGNFWSEDYDTISNAAERKKVILDLVDSLAAMNSVQFKQLYQELLPIIEHNRNRFYSPEFQNTLWDELQKNCSEALLKQQELSEQLPGGVWAYNVNQIFERTTCFLRRWQHNLDYFIDNNHINVEKFKLTYPKLFKHYQSQKYSLDDKS